VVATTLVRGFSADVTGLVVPAPVRPVARSAPPRHAAPRPAPVARVLPQPAAAPALDDSGAAFGRTAAVLPYVPVPPPVHADPVPPVPLSPVSSRSRDGAIPVAAGLLILLSCAHLHRALRADPRSPG
jgi:hypothetical protein